MTAIREYRIKKGISQAQLGKRFLALIDDYVFYYKQEKKAQAEVRKNGMTIKATSASGKEYDKENPAIKAAALFNKQKLTMAD